jgi:hypothetical protein
MAILPSLAEAQRWMRDRIHNQPGGASDLLNPQGGEAGGARLAVYAGGYVARTREALEETYEAVRRVLGASEFSTLASAYAEAHPSRDYNLTWFGRHLPAFLAGTRWAARLPFLPDLARLEWRVSESFHAFDGPPADLAPLISRPVEAWADWRLLFQPSVGLVESEWPVFDIWQARTAPQGRIDIDLVNRAQRILVCRRNTAVRCEPLEPVEFRLLALLLEGGTLGAACEAVADGADEPGAVAGWFARWVSYGMIAGCEQAAAPRGAGAQGAGETGNHRRG